MTNSAPQPDSAEFASPCHQCAARVTSCNSNQLYPAVRAITSRAPALLTEAASKGRPHAPLVCNSTATRHQEDGEGAVGAQYSLKSTYLGYKSITERAAERDRAQTDAGFAHAVTKRCGSFAFLQN